MKGLRDRRGADAPVAEFQTFQSFQTFMSRLAATGYLSNNGLNYDVIIFL